MYSSSHWYRWVKVTYLDQSSRSFSPAHAKTPSDSQYLYNSRVVKTNHLHNATQMCRKDKDSILTQTNKAVKLLELQASPGIWRTSPPSMSLMIQAQVPISKIQCRMRTATNTMCERVSAEFLLTPDACAKVTIKTKQHKDKERGYNPLENLIGSEKNKRIANL